LSAGIIIFAHGSRIESANDAVRAVAAEAAQLGDFENYEIAFLDYPPRLDDAVRRLKERSVARILVVPYFLTLGLHLQRDLPAIIERLKAEHPGVQIEVTAPLDGHEALARIVADRVRGQ